MTELFYRLSMLRFLATSPSVYFDGVARTKWGQVHTSEKHNVLEEKLFKPDGAFTCKGNSSSLVSKPAARLSSISGITIKFHSSLQETPVRTLLIYKD